MHRLCRLLCSLSFPYVFRSTCWKKGLIFFLFTTSFISVAQSDLFVSIAPQAYIVDRIGGDLIKVNVLIGDGQSPHLFEPSLSQLQKISNGKAYFTIGLPFEKHLVSKIKSIQKKLKVFPMDKDVEKTRRHFSDDGYHHELDPHIWLAPSLVEKMAGSVLSALKAIDGNNYQVYLKNYQLFIGELRELNSFILKELSSYVGNTILVFHPAFGYFLESYGLQQSVVEVEGKTPTARQLQKLIENARKDGVKVVFGSKRFSIRGPQIIADAIGGRVVQVDPLEYDLMKNLKEITILIKEELKNERDVRR